MFQCHLPTFNRFGSHTAISQLFFFPPRKTSQYPAQCDSINRVAGECQEPGGGPNSTLQQQSSPRDRVQPTIGGLAVLEWGRPQRRSGRCSSPGKTFHYPSSLSLNGPQRGLPRPHNLTSSLFVELLQPIVFFSYLIFIIICNS